MMPLVVQGQPCGFDEGNFPDGTSLEARGETNKSNQERNSMGN